MTQVEQVAAHLEKYGDITSWEAFALYRITRLASCIHDLRKAGVEIETELVYEGKKHYAKYKVPLPVSKTEERQEGALPSNSNTLFLGGQYERFESGTADAPDGARTL